MSIDRNNARTLSGISEGNGGNISLPSTPDAIRIAGQRGPRGYLVGVDNTSGNVSWVQASTPFIPANSIIGEDLSLNIGFQTTASENGGVIRVHNSGNTGTLQADRGVFSNLTISGALEQDTIQVKQKLIAQATTDNTRKLEIVSSNGDLIQYESYTDSTTNTEYASIKEGNVNCRDITGTGNALFDGLSVGSSSTDTKFFTMYNGGFTPNDITAIISSTATGGQIGLRNITGGTSNQTITLNGITGDITATNNIVGNQISVVNSLFSTTLEGVRDSNKLFDVDLADTHSTLNMYNSDGNLKVSLSGNTGDIAVNNVDCESIEADGNLTIDGNTALNGTLGVEGNTHLKGDLRVDGNFDFGGDLNLNDIIFDGIFSQRLDGTQASTELVSSVAIDSSVGVNGGGKIIVKNKQSPGSSTPNVISDSITLDGADGSITADNMTTTNLTATNFTFDNNLRTKIITADAVDIVNNLNSDALAIALNGQDGSIDLSYVANSSGKLRAKFVESTGNLVGNILGVSQGGSFGGNVDCANLNANSGAPNGVVNCRKLTAQEFEFDNNLITRELQSDRISVVDKDNGDLATIVLDGGVNPDFPTFPAGSMVLMGSLYQSGGATSSNGKMNVLLGGLQVGATTPANPNVDCEINGTLFCKGQRAVMDSGLTLSGVGTANSLIVNGPIYNESNDESSIRKLKIQSDVGYIEFGNASGELRGYTSFYPTRCINLDLTDSSNLFPTSQDDRYKYVKVWDCINHQNWTFNGGMTQFQNMLGYDTAGNRRTNMDFTFQSGGTEEAGGNTSEISFTYFGRLSSGGYIIALRNINSDGTEGDIIGRTHRLLSTNPLEDKQHTHRFIISGLNRNQDYKVAPYFFATDTSPSTQVAVFDNGPVAGGTLSPYQAAYGPWIFRAESLTAINFDENNQNLQP